MTGLRLTPLACALVAGFFSSEAIAVSIETVPVGNAGNAADTRYGGYGPVGAVAYSYNIGKYEVTAGQYCEFLNKVAASDPYELYNMDMGKIVGGCQIKRSGISGSYTYTIAARFADRPANFVSFWDACRFTNWLHNGQPTGDQGPSTTETGAYTLNGYNGVDGRSIQRNADWKWAVTSEDEWYKAAYHKNDGVTNNYFDYPTSSNGLPSNALGYPDPGNNATFYYGGVYTIGGGYWRTLVGEHENSDSPYGTFDQGGNVSEWNEEVVYESSVYVNRGIRGGSFESSSITLRASYRTGQATTWEGYNHGFRVVQVPEPTTLALLSLLGLTVVRRNRP